MQQMGSSENKRHGYPHASQNHLDTMASPTNESKQPGQLVFPAWDEDGLVSRQENPYGKWRGHAEYGSKQIAPL